MPLTLPAAPTPPTLANPATFEANASASLAWMTTIATALSGKALLVSDILGAVSQSGGAPTGALMEYTNNANGQLYRFANGLQIAITGFSMPSSGITSAYGGGFQTPSAAWTYPGEFITEVATFAMVYDCFGSRIANQSLIGCNIHGTAPTSVATLASRYVRAAAIGRWYN